MKKIAILFVLVLVGLLSVGVVSAIDVEGGQFSRLALDDFGNIFSCGRNNFGQLGLGDTLNRLVPTQIALSGVTGIGAGSDSGGHAVALIGGNVFAWGHNNAGQLGDGTTTTRLTPVQVKNVTGSPGFLDNIVQVVACGGHNIALKEDGTVFTWGLNGHGQLGIDSLVNSPLPVQVKNVSGSPGFLSDVINVSCGRDFSFAIKNDGTLFAWGGNAYGQLGDTSTTDKKLPVQIAIGNVQAVSGGFFSSIALKNDGTVFGWGRNLFGEIGDGTTTPRKVLVQVKNVTGSPGFLDNIAAISSGVIHSLALRNDGTVFGWGRNRDGQLGDGTTTDRLTPVQVKNVTGSPGFLSNIVRIDAGGGYSLAVNDGGTIFSWGDNRYGSLCDGTTIDRLIPVQSTPIVIISDSDGDGFADDVDNCINDFNALQDDEDEDGIGDICDVCPVTSGETCPGESAAKEINASDGGFVNTSTASVEIPANALSSDETIIAEETGAYTGGFAGLWYGTAISFGVIFGPTGTNFDVPVTVCITFDTFGQGTCTNNPFKIGQDADGDSVYDELTTSACTDLGGNLMELCAETSSFTEFRVFGVDRDDDGVLDNVDSCLGSVLPEPVDLVPNNFADIDGDGIFEVNGADSEITLADTHGCTCLDILEIKPGEDEGEIKFGCAKGTIDTFLAERGWAKGVITGSTISNLDKTTPKFSQIAILVLLATIGMATFLIVRRKR